MTEGDLVVDEARRTISIPSAEVVDQKPNEVFFSGADLSVSGRGRERSSRTTPDACVASQVCSAVSLPATQRTAIPKWEAHM
jgi:hypothetical protein